MTDRLYYSDAYLTRFEAGVRACAPAADGRYRILLNQSAFYPTSGGQPFDTGILGGARILSVEVEDGDVAHYTDRPLAPGARVEGIIDWPRRFDHMQQHAADHLIASALRRFFGGVTIGLHIGEAHSTIDVAMPEGRCHLTDEEIRQVEDDVNDKIWRDVPIRCWFPTEEELERLPLRKPPTVRRHVRIVAIGDEEMVPCGGTHPARAGEIGPVKILSTAPARGKMRVAFLAGRRAFEDYRASRAAAREAAALCSTGFEHLAEAVRAQQARLTQLEVERGKLLSERLDAQAQGLFAQAEALPCGARLIARVLPIGADEARKLASRLIETPGTIALIGCAQGRSCAWVFGRSQDVALSIGAVMTRAARAAGGKGGGRPDFAQGGGPREMLTVAAELVRSELNGST